MFDHIKNLWVGEVAVQVVLAATVLGAARFNQGAQGLFEGVLLAGFGDQGSDGGEWLGHARLQRSGMNSMSG
jgi:hypothetical protein